MINLLSGGAFTEANKQGLNPAYYGLLTSPSSRNSPQHAIDRNLPWACDNDCFLKYDPVSIHAMLKRYQGLSGCVFMNAPDVVLYWRNGVAIQRAKEHAETLNALQQR